MLTASYTLTVDSPRAGVITLVLAGPDSVPVGTSEIAYEGPVDNLLLTAVDNLLKTHTIDRSTLVSVAVGSGIDKNSSLYRIVTSFASAVAAAHAVGR